MDTQTVSNKKTKQHRTLWISDVHLGTRDCQARALLDFLAHNEAETIYLVGDIIDGWQLKKRWYWPQTHNDVIQKLLRKARKGTRIVYITGNHDMFIRDFIHHLDEGDGRAASLVMGGIELVDECTHTTADGRKIWILHGDLFDGVVQNMQWLAKIGDELYMFALKANRWLNLWRAKMGWEYWSLSQYLKDRVKNAVSYIDSFETAVATEAQRRGCQAVLCGHIHKAQMRDINGVTYLNSGDWVESLTAVAEDARGQLSIIEWGKISHRALEAEPVQAEAITPPEPVHDTAWAASVANVLNTTRSAFVPTRKRWVRL